MNDDTQRESSRVAMIAMARKDAAELDAWESWANNAPPTEFQAWAGKFAADPALWKSAPPAEATALIRLADLRPGWLEEPMREQLRTGVREQLAGVDAEVVYGSRVHAVDELRRAQNPQLAEVRAGLLEALDDAFDAMRRTGAPVQTALAKVLHERGLVTLDGELGEPWEHVATPVRRDPAATERRLPPALGRPAEGRGVGR